MYDTFVSHTFTRADAQPDKRGEGSRGWAQDGGGGGALIMSTEVRPKIVQAGGLPCSAAESPAPAGAHTAPSIVVASSTGPWVHL